MANDDTVTGLLAEIQQIEERRIAEAQAAQVTLRRRAEEALSAAVAQRAAEAQAQHEAELRETQARAAAVEAERRSLETARRAHLDAVRHAHAEAAEARVSALRASHEARLTALKTSPRGLSALGAVGLTVGLVGALAAGVWATVLAPRSSDHEARLGALSASAASARHETATLASQVRRANALVAAAEVAPPRPAPPRAAEGAAAPAPRGVAARPRRAAAAPRENAAVGLEGLDAEHDVFGSDDLAARPSARRRPR